MVSECYVSVFNFISYPAKCTNYFFVFDIFESVQYYYSELYHSGDSTSTFATLFTCIALLACILIAYYYLYKDIRKVEESFIEADKMLTKELVIQSKIQESITRNSKFNEDVNMAVYMSEMRRKSKETRPERPIEVEERAPEHMPNLRAERCLKDGLAVLNIIDEKEKTPDKKSTENISMEYTSLTFGPQKGISMNECLQSAHGTLEFVNDTSLDIIDVPNTNKINSEPQKPNTQQKSDPKNSSLLPKLKKKSEFESHYAMRPSTADVNSIRLSKPSASFKAVSLPRETSTHRIKPRPVSRNTNNSCDRKPQKPNTQQKSDPKNSSLLPKLKKKSEFESHYTMRPSTADVNSIRLSKPSASFKAVSLPRETSTHRIKPRPVSRNTNNSCDRKPQKPNTQQKSDPKNSSLLPKLKKKSEFESHYTMRPSTADVNSIRLSKPSASSRAVSLPRETLTLRIKPRPVSRNTNNSCDGKHQKPNTQQKSDPKNSSLLPKLKKKSEFESHYAMRPSTADVNSIRLSKPSASFKAVLLPRETSTPRIKPRPVSRNTNNSCDRKPQKPNTQQKSDPKNSSLLPKLKKKSEFESHYTMRPSTADVNSIRLSKPSASFKAVSLPRETSTHRIKPRPVSRNTNNSCDRKPQKPNTQQKSDPKNSSLLPKLKKKSEFESHYTMRPSTADVNSIRLSKPSASSRAVSLPRETLTLRIKPRPVSRNTNNSCDGKHQKPNTQQKSDPKNSSLLPKLKKKSEFESHYAMRPSTADVNSIRLSKPSASFKAVLLPRETSTPRIKPRPVSRNTNNSCDRKPSTADGNSIRLSKPSASSKAVSLPRETLTPRIKPRPVSRNTNNRCDIKNLPKSLTTQDEQNKQGELSYSVCC